MLKLFHMSAKSFLSKLNRKNTPLLPKIKPLFWIFIFILSLSTAFFVTKPVQAQGNFVQKWLNNVADKTMENWGDTFFDNIQMSVLTRLVGGEELSKYISNREIQIETGQKPQVFLPGGALGTTQNLIAQTYVIPVSGVQYLAGIKDNFLGKPAYAQYGQGYDSLQPLIKIWRGFRNIIYILFSFFFIIIGLMIMFRIKTGPQTIVTIQNAVPKIITSLILVTFSYAIAGLLIDLMNLIQAMVLALLYTTVQNKNLSQSLFNADNGFPFSTLASPHLSSIYLLSAKALPMNTLAALGSLVGAIIGLIFTPGLLPARLVAGGIGTIGGTLLMLLVVVIAVLIWQLKYFFGLVVAYLNVLLKIILAPFEIGFGAFPGAKIGFGTWFIQLFAHLAVFPISFLFLVLVNVIIDNIQNNPLVRGGSVWMPSIMNPDGNLVNFVTGLSGGLPAAAIGLGAVFLLSKLPKMIPEFIFQLKPSPWGTAIGETSKGITAPIGKNVSGMAKTYIGSEIEQGSQGKFPLVMGGVEKLLNRISKNPDDLRKSIGQRITKS